MNDISRKQGNMPVCTEFGASMLRIERREWWLWSSAVLVTLLLTAGIASFILPLILSQSDASEAFSFDQV